MLNGKRLFITGLGRWSLNGAAWGSCAACHVDGLTDDVTWYFARGPRQTTSLDGTFGKNPPAGTVDQRILNWTAVNDEIADFEGNVRGISGGVGAIVSSVSSAAPGTACTVATEATVCTNSKVCNPLSLTCTPANADRINTFAETPPQQGLQGSSTAAASPTGASAHSHSVLSNWADITNYVAQIRSPRAVRRTRPTRSPRPTSRRGRRCSRRSGNCVGCHSGEKWTLSTVFYTPGDVPNDASGSVAPDLAVRDRGSRTPSRNGFPAALFPFHRERKQLHEVRRAHRVRAAPVRSSVRWAPSAPRRRRVPTGVSPAAVNVLELRQDMVTGAQGAGRGERGNDFTAGYNIPSLLGLQVGAPYFHAGNARTLEELFNTTLSSAHYAVARGAVFTPTPTTVRQLVAYLLSIDGSTTAPVAPGGAERGGRRHLPLSVTREV